MVLECVNIVKMPKSDKNSMSMGDALFQVALYPYTPVLATFLFLTSVLMANRCVYLNRLMASTSSGSFFMR